MPAIGTGGIYQAILAKLEALQTQVSPLAASIAQIEADIAAAEEILESYGVTKAYTKAEVDALLGNKANTSTLADYLTTAAAASGYVPQARTVSTSGLLSGGGALSSNLALTIAKANTTDAQGGVLDDRVLTPLTGKALVEQFAKTIKNVQFFAGSSTYVPTSGTTKAIIVATGGGAGGDSGLASVGGAGATVIHFLSDPQPDVVTVGAGGAEGANGGTTSFGDDIVAPGGQASGAGGSTASASGLIKIAGGAGFLAATTPAVAVSGASWWGGEGAYGAGGLDSAGFGGCVMVLEF